jgi:3-hexulose-6-phosphate synthase
MKLQISFDMTNIDAALSIAEKVAPHADILEVGTLLIYAHGIQAVKQFRQAFPHKTILADTKLVDRAKDAVALFAKSGADWITVMAGTNKNVIHSVCTAAHEANMKVMLDLLDSGATGQSALEAKNLGIDALLFHQPYSEEATTFLDQWEMIHGNTDLPIFISNNIKRSTVDRVLEVKPDGIIVGTSIIESDDPAQEAAFFYNLCHQ